jgi:hypothetical protein
MEPDYVNMIYQLEQELEMVKYNEQNAWFVAGALAALLVMWFAMAFVPTSGTLP